MERRYFQKNVQNVWGTSSPKRVTRYIVSAEEWNSIQKLCSKFTGSSCESLKKIANSIKTYHKPYSKQYETEPEMPNNSISFILYEDESYVFESFCLDLLFQIY